MPSYGGRSRTTRRVNGIWITSDGPQAGERLRCPGEAPEVPGEDRVVRAIRTVVLAPGPGAALREGWRFFVGTAAIPLAELVASQLGEALGEPALQLDMRRSLAAERTTQAMAAARLAAVDGVTYDQARETVGL